MYESLQNKKLVTEWIWWWKMKDSKDDSKEYTESVTLILNKTIVRVSEN